MLSQFKNVNKIYFSVSVNSSVDSPVHFTFRETFEWMLTVPDRTKQKQILDTDYENSLPAHAVLKLIQVCCVQRSCPKKNKVNGEAPVDSIRF